MADMRIADADHQHRRVVLARAVAVAGVEAIVARDAQRSALDRHHDVPVLGEELGSRRHAVEGTVDGVAKHGEPRTAGQQHGSDERRECC